MGVDQAQSATGRRRRRVAALPPEDRRRALIAATIPLLREHGTAVSTRQIADAAGVAEGTIFGVFKDKETLLRAATMAAFDPVPLLRSLKSVNPSWDLRRRLVEAARLVREHVAGHGAIFHVVRGPLFAHDRQAMVDMMATRFLVLNELTALIEPDSARLRRSPAIAARLILSLVGSPRGAFGALDEALSDEEVVSLVLDGLLVSPPPSDSAPTTTGNSTPTTAASPAASPSRVRARPAATGSARSRPAKES